MKTKTELLKLLLEYCEIHGFTSGIKHNIFKMWCANMINAAEDKILMDLINENKPVSDNFTKHHTWQDVYFWWAISPEGNAQRILFLKHLIEICPTS